MRMRMIARYLQSLFFRKPLSAGASALVREWSFIHIGGLGGEWNRRVTQQFLPAGRGGCENEHGFQIVSGTPSVKAQSFWWASRMEADNCSTDHEICSALMMAGG